MKDTTTTAFGDSTNQPRVSRGGRAGFDSGRGGRGRGADRGRGGKGRGASVAHTNGTRKENAEVSTPTTESNAWGATSVDAPTWDTAKPAEKTSEDTHGSGLASATAAAASSIIPDGLKKSWASILQPKPVAKKAPEPVEKFVLPQSNSTKQLTIFLDPQSLRSQKNPPNLPPKSPKLQHRSLLLLNLSKNLMPQHLPLQNPNQHQSHRQRTNSPRITSTRFLMLTALPPQPIQPQVLLLAPGTLETLPPDPQPTRHYSKDRHRQFGTQPAASKLLL